MFLCLVRRQHESLATLLFHKVDIDGGGTIEEEEVQALSSRMGNRLDKVQLREAMEDMDADGSGEVDLEEFQEWFGRGKEIDAVVTELNLSSVLQSISKPGAFVLDAEQTCPLLLACFVPSAMMKTPKTSITFTDLCDEYQWPRSERRLPPSQLSLRFGLNQQRH